MLLMGSTHAVVLIEGRVEQRVALRIDRAGSRSRPRGPIRGRRCPHIRPCRQMRGRPCPRSRPHNDPPRDGT
jgi:hypothetical protein